MPQNLETALKPRVYHALMLIKKIPTRYADIKKKGISTALWTVSF